ncbi:S9 family peptidase [Bdellovibrio sp. HCB337]|uniref:S9 family peptidase n=1 Tax=Bdellovibrio sp. HCB337 TaxID=3394358 RepID=UPI0039A4A723
MKTSLHPSIPQASKYPQTFNHHGDQRVDPYFWLKDVQHPETKPYLEAENAHTNAYFEDYKNCETKLFEELKARIVKDDSTPPAKSNSYYYYTRMEGDKEQPIQCRRKGSADGPEEVILDCNELAKGFKSFSLGIFDTSPDHDVLAYATDTDGDEVFSLYFKDLKTGKLFPEQIEKIYYSSAWSKDNKTFYYITQNENMRPDKMWKHTLGTPISQDEVLFEEKDNQYFISCHLSESEEYIFLNRHSHGSSEFYYLDAKNPQSKPQLFSKLEERVEYNVTHRGNYFYIMTNKNAQTFKLCRTPVGKTSQEHWETLIEAKPEITLKSLYAFQDFMMIGATEKALQTLYKFDYDTFKMDQVKFPDPIYQVSMGANYEFATDWVRLNYNSMVQPNQTYDLNMKTQEKIVRKIQQIPSGYNAEEYTSERVWATSHDGVKVPVSLVYKKALRKNGPQPTLLYAYGSYGMAMPAAFSSHRISLLDRGYVFAIAHIRGGSDMGRQWYEEGKFLKKKNTFHDFISSAEYLIQNKYSEPKTLSIMGGSAGGMLMGAVVNMRPELFNSALAIVPFVDVLNTMLDASLPLTQMEYQEWGNPEVSKEYYDYIKSYSPYDNVKSQAYPNIYIKAGLNDPRVTYWEPAKWCAKLREHKTDHHVLLLETDMESGHAGASGRFEYLKEIARQYTFILATGTPDLCKN